MIADTTKALAALARRSVEIIQRNQAPSGAYVASPNFPVYGYCWFRDGAFIADAMSRAGEIASAEAFFAWCTTVLVARRERIDSLLARHRAGEQIPATDFLHTRYTLDGRESDAVWENFQLDGYGAWLWALDAHRVRHRRSIEPYLRGAALSVDYITAFWDHPSYDWWEEHADHRHTSTLAAIHAGLSAAERWSEISPEIRERAAVAGAAIRGAVMSDAMRLGHLAKWFAGTAVDASLVAVATPFGLLDVHDELMRATVDRIEVELDHGGGVHRYLSDTYYGGGEWLLLSALLGWHRLRAGDEAGARRQLAWVAAQATPSGELPEQVDGHLLAPAAEQAWLDRWGPIATPLLWSHAMYLTLALEIGVWAPSEAPHP